MQGRMASAGGIEEDLMSVFNSDFNPFSLVLGEPPFEVGDLASSPSPESAKSFDCRFDLNISDSVQSEAISF